MGELYTSKICGQQMGFDGAAEISPARLEIPDLALFGVGEHFTHDSQVSLPRPLGSVGIHPKRQRVVIRVDRDPDSRLRAQADLCNTRLNYRAPGFTPCANIGNPTR